MHEGEWKPIPIDQVGTNGVPYPEFNRGVLIAIWLCGYEQAMCLAYRFAAAEAALGRKCKVRVREYRVEYDIKAWEVEQDD